MRLKRKKPPSYNQALSGAVVKLATSALRDQADAITELRERVKELEAENARLRKRCEWRAGGTS